MDVYLSKITCEHTWVRRRLAYEGDSNNYLIFFLGWFEIYINGEKEIGVHNITLRESNESIYTGVHFQTFFGGE